MPPSTVAYDVALLPHATLQAITEAAVDATAASHGWLLAVDGDDLVAVVTTGTDNSATTRHVVSIGEGSAGYVLSSGQPLALQVRPGDTNPWSTEHPLVGRVPTSLVSVPCDAGAGLVGVLELVDSARGSFSFDDVEVVTLLGGIAGTALTDGAIEATTVASPDELGRELALLLADHPTRYARVAVVLQALLSDG